MGKTSESEFSNYIENLKWKKGWMDGWMDDGWMNRERDSTLSCNCIFSLV